MEETGMMGKGREIGDIHNSEGGVYIKEENGKFYWLSENWNCEPWEEIPHYLYFALNKYQDEREE